jgi:hypothetical protein
MAASSTITRSRGGHAAALVVGAAGFGLFGGCGGSTGAETRCNRGDTRICLHESAGCEGTQSCRPDGNGFGTCECETSGTGGASGSGAGGSSASGGVSGAATTGGASGAAVGGVSGAGGSDGGTAGFGAIGGQIGFGGSSFGGTDAGSCSSVRTHVELTPLVADRA